MASQLFYSLPYEALLIDAPPTGVLHYRRCDRKTTDEPMEKSIGFIGMGTMGSRMAARLLGAGHRVTVFNRDKAKTKPLVQQGATAADTIPELVRNVDYICISVSNDQATREIIDQIVQAECTSKTIISLSTISPDTAAEVAKVIASHKAQYLDAPVSGSAPQVEAAQLVIFVGGEKATFDDAQPIFRAISKTAYLIGPAGDGSRMKLVTNTLLGLGAQSLAEALLLGQRMGMDKRKMIEVLSETAVVSPSQKIKLQNALANDYPVAFSLANMYKDYGLILDQARSTNTPLPATAAAEQIAAIGMARQLDADFAVVIRLLEEFTRVP
ncbi:MAG: Hgd [Candidatus Saccharibacteria bacterium]|nr:Hgd [Candidatus Saccharibacteria bacterium]